MQKWVLFFTQIVLITISSYGQIPATIHSKTGANISWFGFWLLFSLINANLCYGAWRKEKETNLLLQTIIHGIWSAVAFTNVACAFAYDKYRVDVPIIIFVSLGCIITYLVARVKYDTGLQDPIVKGTFSILCRVIPQLTLCYYMLDAGASGVSWQMVLTGHCTILIRLWNLRKDLKNRDAKASFIADAANEVSWLIATAVWIKVSIG